MVVSHSRSSKKLEGPLLAITLLAIVSNNAPFDFEKWKMLKEFQQKKRKNVRDFSMFYTI